MVSVAVGLMSPPSIVVGVGGGGVEVIIVLMLGCVSGIRVFSLCLDPVLSLPPASVLCRSVGWPGSRDGPLFLQNVPPEV